MHTSSHGTSIIENSLRLFSRHIKNYFSLLAIVCSTSMTFGQTPTYQIILRNDSLISSTIYDFDIVLENSGVSVFELATLQGVMTFNSGITSDTLSLTILPGSSELLLSQQPTNAKLSIAGNELRIAPNSPPGSGSGTVIPAAPGLRVGRFRLTANSSFSNETASITWKNSGSNPVTKINAYIGPTNTIITDSTGHLNQLLNPPLSPIVITNASPLPPVTAGVPYAETLTAIGGTPPYAWSIVNGALPSGLTLSAPGIISGTATVADTATFSVQVIDSLLTASSKSFSVIVLPGAAHHLVFTQQASSGGAGAVLSPPAILQLKDFFGNNVSHAGDTVSIAISSGNGVLSGTTRRLTSASGAATFDDLKINFTGVKILTASSTGLISAASSPLTISAGAPSVLLFVQQPTDTTSNSIISPPITVQVEDSLGNPVRNAGISLVLSIASGTGSLSGTTTRTTDTTGLASFNNIRIDLAGSKTLRTASAGLTSAVSDPFNISSGPASQIVFTQQPANTAAGAPITPSVTLRLRDAAGNDVATPGVSVSVFLIGSGTLGGTTIRPTNGSGTASFNNLTVDSAGSKFLRAVSGILTPDTSNAFTISPAAASKLAFVQQPLAGIAGTILTPAVTVKLKDSFGNDVALAGDTISIALSSGSGILSGTLKSLTNATGLASFDDLVINQAGLKALTAAGTGLTPVVSDTFSLSGYTISSFAGANGSISPSGVVTLASGASQAYTVSPNTGYHVDSLIVDGTNQGALTTYTFSNVNSNHTIRAVFAINTYTLTASAGVNGSISPSGSVLVDHGSSQLFTLTPSVGYHVDSVIVDGANQGQVSSYTFVNVTANHTIRTAFAINKYTITASAGLNGSISPSGSVLVDHGSSQLLTLTPSAGYHVDSVIVDGANQGQVSSYTFVNVIANHTIRAVFAIDQFTISASAGVNGSIAPSGSVFVNRGSNQTFNFTPSTGYHVDSVIVDGANQGQVSSYTFVNVTANHTIRAVFAIDQFTISASAGVNGSIAPSGSVIVNRGSNQTFNITPSTGYHVDSLFVDSIAQTPAASYTFNNVTSNHSIRVVFAINQFTITASAGANGTLTPTGSVGVSFDASQLFTLNPNTGYHVDSVIVDGANQGQLSSYTFVNVTANHTIRAVFAINRYTIAASAGLNGSISPSGSVLVNHGSSQLFTVTPSAGYHVDSVIVDGTNLGQMGSYTFVNVTANHTIRAVFAIDQFTISASAGVNGSIAPSGTVIVNRGSNQTFNFTPSTCYHVDSLFVDSVAQTPAASYAFNNVTANHIIRAVFAINQFTITASAGSNGSISPSGSVNASCGSNQAFTLTPNTGYHVDSLIIDGTNFGQLTNYTFSNIAANHTIRAVFAPNSIQVIVQTVPAGLQIIVDNVSFASPHTFNWIADQTHSVRIIDSVAGGTGRRFVWNSWSDAGTKAHSITPLVNSTLTANFLTQFFLTMSANTGGTVSPSSGWRDSSSVVQIEGFPSPATKYAFSSWSGSGNGSYSGSSNPITITMNGSISEIANFVRLPIQITIQTSPPGRSFVYDGTVYITPQTITVNPGIPHSLDMYFNVQPDTAAGKQYVWTSWSDGGARAHQITPDSNTTYTAIFTTQYFLNLIALTGGTVSPSAWQDSGLVVPIAATPGNGYTFAGWRGKGNGSYTGILNPSSVKMNGPINDTATFTLFPVSVTINSIPTGRTIIVDGVPTVAPRTYVWTSLSTHSIATVDSQLSAGIRYLYRTWSDGGTLSHNVSTSKDTSFTVLFSQQFFLTTSADSGGTVTPSSGWRDSGSVANIMALPGNGYVFGNWTGTGAGSYTGTTNPISISMIGPVSETAHFVRFNASVTIQTVPSGLSIIVDSVTYTSPHTFFWITGSSHTIATVDIQTTSAGTRYVWSSWSDGKAISHTIVPAGDMTIAASFTKQYFLTMAANTGGVVTPLSNWYISGDVVPIEAIPSGKYDFTVWSGAGNGSNSSGANPTSVTMNGPITQVANFTRKPIQITIQSFPPGRLFEYDGTTFSTAQTFTIIPGSTHVLDIFFLSQLDSMPGKQFVWDHWSDGGSKFHNINPDTNTTYTAYFRPQHFLRIETAGGGTTSPSSGWQDSGKVVSISANPNPTYSFTGWRGSGVGSYTGPDNPASVTMNAAIYDTATFTQSPIQFTIQTNPPGRTFIVDGIVDTTSQVYVWNYGSAHTITTLDSQTAGIGTRYLWRNWSDGGAISHGIVATRDTTLILNFQTQYMLTMNAGIGGSVSPASGWYDAGATVNLSASPNTTFTFGGWNGAGTISYTGSSNPASVTMNSPITESASFVQIPVYVTIQTSPEGRSYLVDGVKYLKSELFTWNISSSHTIEVPSPQEGGQGVQYAWKSWSDGGTIRHTITPNADTTITANFITQYMLTNAADSGGSVSPASGWQDSGKSVQLLAVANSGFQFSGWNGTGPGEYTGINNPVTIRMDGPITQLASFSRYYAQVTVRTLPAGLKINVDGADTTSPALFSWLTGSSHIVTLPDTQSGTTGRRYLWSSWSDGGAKSHVVTILGDSIIIGNFSTQYFLTMNANVGGTVDPPPPGAWFSAGHQLNVTGIPDSTFTFARWNGTGNGAYDGFLNPAIVTMNGPITELANFRRIPVIITVETNPDGRTFMFDGASYTTRQSFTVDPGTSHALDAPTPQFAGPGMQYAWSSWSDSGARFHIIFPTTNRTFVANFGLQYSLTSSVNPVLSGSINPTGTGYYDKGDTVPMTATPSAGYAFSSWSGDTSGLWNPIGVIMNSPKAMIANFSPAAAVTIATNPAGRNITVDGIAHKAPVTFSWIKGSLHSISTTSPQSDTTDIQYLWRNWSDSGSISHSVAPSRDTTFIANFSTEYYLTMVATPGGSVTPLSGWRQKNQAVLLRAIPDVGYHFNEWTGTGPGAYSGTRDTATILMNGPIAETANFGIILPLPELSGIPDNSTGISTSPILSWMTYPGMLSYRLQISRDSLFSNVIIDSSGIPDTSFRLTALANFTKYYWRVNARVISNITPFSAYRAFTTMNATITLSSPLLHWGTGYRYDISWSSVDLSGSVNVRLSLNGGVSYRPIKDSTQDDGLYSWTVPDSATLLSSSCKLRVESVLNPLIYSESNLFAIVSGTLPASISPLSAVIPFSDEPYVSTEYKLFSLPGIVDTIKVESFLSGTQKKEWRMFSDNGSAVDYLEELSPSSTLSTGTGYWLVKKGNLNIPSFTMIVPHLSPDATFAIGLHAGWNIIANPFNRGIPWQAALLANGLPDSTQLIDYHGTYKADSSMEPFKGYYYFNSTGQSTLKIPYPFGTTLPSTTIATRQIPEQGWRIQLALTSDINEDAANYIGIAPGTKQGIDGQDAHKPPLFLDQSFLYFSRPNWDPQYDRFSRDIRPSIGAGQEWKFTTTHPRTGRATLTINGVENIPAEYRAVLINELNTVPIDIKNHPTMVYEAISKTMSWKILIGSEEFIRGEIAKLVPVEFELTQNFPNPFNPTTSISIKLPRDADVRLEIYSILGQRVKVLADGRLDAGVHSFEWNGTDEMGNNLSSGVYLYRLLEGGRMIESKKMIFAK